MTDLQSLGRYRSPSGGPLLREVPAGMKLILNDRSLVEVVQNPGDGGWVRVRYIEAPAGSPAVGDEEWVFYTNVRDFAEDQGSSVAPRAPESRLTHARSAV